MVIEYKSFHHCKITLMTDLVHNVDNNFLIYLNFKFGGKGMFTEDLVKYHVFLRIAAIFVKCSIIPANINLFIVRRRSDVFVNFEHISHLL